MKFNVALIWADLIATRLGKNTIFITYDRKVTARGPIIFIEHRFAWGKPHALLKALLLSWTLSATDICEISSKRPQIKWE
jgi:hypothetical protein